MRKLMAALVAALLVPACSKAHHDRHGGRPVPPVGSPIFTTPCGLTVWGFGSGVTDRNSTGVRSDGTAWLSIATYADAGKALDGLAHSYLENHSWISETAFWQRLRSIKFYLEDDYLFYVIGVAQDVPSALYATGETLQLGSDERIFLAIWSRDDNEKSYPSFAPVWTIREPFFGGNGSPFWHCGRWPMVPALTYELGWIFGTNKASEAVKPGDGQTHLTDSDLVP